MDADSKTCPRCKAKKPEAEWHPSQWVRNGGWCKECVLDLLPWWSEGPVLLRKAAEYLERP